ncbi:hypothetical protein JY66_09340 [Neisseria meningitidis]|nr:hypothetical protein JY66_09340 [Neisseria meningitidis]
MRSLLVRAMFGERMEGRFVLQSGKRSSENRVQTTFWFSWEGLWFKKTACVCTAHTLHTDSKFCVICRSGVPKDKDTVGQATY